MEENTRVEGRKRVSLSSTWREMPRTHQLMVAAVPLLVLSVCVVHVIAWARHEAPLQVYWVAIAMLSMLAICVWHAVVVKGAVRAAAFFAICVLIGWFCEFIGHNYGWFFGDYDYTDALGPAIGGVPLLISCTWSFIVYSAFMLIDWLTGAHGEVHTRTWWGRASWSALVAAATATLVCAWDMMVDPMATSGIWKLAGGSGPWWYWSHGGPYLRELHGKGALGEPGIPIGNMVGWWVAPFFMVLVFMLFFQRKNRVSGTPVDIVPLMSYFYIFLIVVLVVLEMNWYQDGMTQLALIGFFTMMPVIMVSAVKLVRDYS